MVRLAARRGLRIVALTDHDTVAGVDEAISVGLAEGVRVIPAVELSCDQGGRAFHLLIYGLPHHDGRLLADLQRRRAVRVRRARRILDRLGALGLRLEREALLGGDRPVGRPQVARAMVAAGYVASVAEAFGRYLLPGRPGWCPPDEPQPPAEAIALAHQLGALAVLAHPAMDRAHQVLPQLVAAGLDGLEVYHGGHTPTLEAAFLTLARRWNLLVTGGSDSHGPDRPPDLGEVAVPGEQVAPFLAALPAGP